MGQDNKIQALLKRDVLITRKRDALSLFFLFVFSLEKTLKTLPAEGSYYISMTNIPTANQINAILSERAKDSHYSLSQQWLQGFVEAEGCFLGRGGQRPIFEITQHASDCFLMLAIKRFIGGGKVRLSKRRDGRLLCVYTLSGKRIIAEKLLPLWHNAYAAPKILRDFQPWLALHFPQEKIVINDTEISGNWLAGFTDGDGSFHTVFRRQEDYKIGFQFQAVFDLAQKNSPVLSAPGDSTLVESTSTASCAKKNVLLSSIRDHWFSDYPSCIAQSSPSQKGVDHLRIVRAAYLDERVIPLFETYKLQSRKEIQFFLWKWGVRTIVKGNHLAVKNREELLAFREVSRCLKDKISPECRKWIASKGAL